MFRFRNSIPHHFSTSVLNGENVFPLDLGTGNYWVPRFAGLRLAL
jgi:hypothetical protein